MSCNPLATLGAELWRPRPHITLADWVTRNVRLSPEWEAGAGHYDLSDNPFWRDILDAFMDPEVRQISIKKSTQIGGTLALQAAIIGLSHLDPAPSMLVGPDELYTVETRDRCYANAEESPLVRRNVPPERLRNSRHIDLGTCRVYLAWAGSAQRLRGRPCKRVFRSEIDVYPHESPRGGDPIKSSAERVKRFYNSTIYDESSPSGDPSRIADLYEAGHRAQWMCKCPHCGVYQAFRFFVFKDGKRAGFGGLAGIRDEFGNMLSPEAVTRSVHYLCIEGCRIGQDEKDKMVRTGKWVAEGQTIDENGEVSGEPTRGRRRLSFHLWSIHSPTITLTDLAIAYFDHKRDGMMREFFQNWLGLRYEFRKRMPEWHEIGARLAGTYRRGTFPREAYFLTAGVDVQLDGCYYVIRAWGDQASSWLVQEGFLQRYEADDVDPDSMTEEELNRFFRSDLRQLTDAVVMRYFRVAEGLNPSGKDRLRPRMIAIDSQHRTREVHAYVQSQNERRVRAIRGEHKIKAQDRFKETIVERPQREGPSYGTPRKVLNIFTPHYKEAIQEKLLMPRDVKGSFQFFSGVVDSSSDYLRQLMNEKPVEVLDKATGRKKTIWKAKSDQWGNHSGDCEVYAFAIAERLLSEIGVGWEVSTWVESSQQVNEMGTIAAVRDDQLLGVF